MLRRYMTYRLRHDTRYNTSYACQHAALKVNTSPFTADTRLVALAESAALSEEDMSTMPENVQVTPAAQGAERLPSQASHVAVTPCHVVHTVNIATATITVTSSGRLPPPLRMRGASVDVALRGRCSRCSGLRPPCYGCVITTAITLRQVYATSSWRMPAN